MGIYPKNFRNRLTFLKGNLKQINGKIIFSDNFLKISQIKNA